MRDTALGVPVSKISKKKWTEGAWQGLIKNPPPMNPWISGFVRECAPGAGIRIQVPRRWILCGDTPPVLGG